MVQPIKFAGCRRFLGDVEHVARVELHARGQFVILDARFQFRLVRIALLMFAIQRGEEIHAVALHALGERPSGLEIQDRRTLGAELGPLVQRGEPTGGPDQLAAGVVAGRVAQHDVRAQVLIEGAKGVTDPGTDRWPALEQLAGAHHD